MAANHQVPWWKVASSWYRCRKRISFMFFVFIFGICFRDVSRFFVLNHNLLPIQVVCFVPRGRCGKKLNHVVCILIWVTAEKQCHSECALQKGQWHAEGWKEQELYQPVVESGWKEEEPSRGTAKEGCCNFPKTNSRSPVTPWCVARFQRCTMKIRLGRGFTLEKLRTAKESKKRSHHWQCRR